jgi:hypothetical protein
MHWRNHVFADYSNNKRNGLLALSCHWTLRRTSFLQLARGALGRTRLVSFKIHFPKRVFGRYSRRLTAKNGTDHGRPKHSSIPVCSLLAPVKHAVLVVEAMRSGYLRSVRHVDRGSDGIKCGILKQLWIVRSHFTLVHRA